MTGLIALIIINITIMGTGFYMGVLASNGYHKRLASKPNRARIRALEKELGFSIDPLDDHNLDLGILTLVEKIDIHPCRPPDVRMRLSGGTEHLLEGTSRYDVGTRWACSCGRVWRVRQFAGNDRAWTSEK